MDGFLLFLGGGGDDKGKGNGKVVIGYLSQIFHPWSPPLKKKKGGGERVVPNTIHTYVTKMCQYPPRPSPPPGKRITCRLGP